MLFFTDVLVKKFRFEYVDIQPLNFSSVLDNANPNVNHKILNMAFFADFSLKLFRIFDKTNDDSKELR